MKKFALSILFILVGLVFSQNIMASAMGPEDQSGVKDGIFTYLASEDGTASIIACDENATGNIVVPDTLGGYKITSISWGAFKNCNEITSLSLPESVTEIGSYAFSDCAKLKELTLYNLNSSLTLALETEDYDPHNSNSQRVKTPIEKITLKGSQTAIPEHAFSDLCYLEEVILTDKIKTIGEHAFSNTKIKSINLPSTLTSIGEYAFSGSGLTSITISKNTSVGKSAFASCEKLKSVVFNAKEVPEYAFEDCSALTSVKFSNDLKNIKEYAFSECSSLTKISFPASLVEISNNAFENCTSLKTINFSDGLKRILSSAFSGCSSIKSLSLPDSLKKIELGAFYDCPNITYIKLPFVGEKRSKSGMFGSIFSLDKEGSLTVEFSSACTYIPANSFHSNTAIKKIILGENLKTIYSSAFYDCSNLKEIVFSKKLENIKSYAFTGCKALKTIVFPSSLKKLGAGCFSACTSLTSVKFGKNTESIGDSAFEECKKLESVKFTASIKEIGDNAFQGCKDLKKANIINGTEKIGNEVFRECTSLTSLYIPDSVTEIGDYILSDAKKCKTLRIPFFGETKDKPCELDMYNIPKKALKKLVIGDECEEIPETAVQEYSNLTTLVIGKNVKTIGDSAFYNCKKLKNITIGNKVTRLGQLCFTNTAYANDKSNWKNKLLYIGKYLIEADKSIKTANIKSGTRIIGGAAFSLCKKLTAVKLPSSVLTIDDAAFWNCSSLKSINFPKKLSFIGSQAFASCISLKKISLPSSLKIIDDNAFWCCYGIESVKIPDKVVKIGNEAFSACTSLKYVTIPRFAQIGKNAFYYTKKLKCVSLCSSNSFYYNSFTGKHISYDGTKAELKKSVNNNKASKFIKKNTVEYYSPKIIKKATLKNAGIIKESCSVCGGYTYERKIAKVKSIKLSKTTFSYNGKVIKPKVIVKDSNGNILQEGRDYTVKYYGKRIKKGTYKILVKLCGDYKGSKTLTFKIK